MTIEIRYDVKRGCGWRAKGGLYMISGEPMAPCGRLPIPLEICPCCGAGFKFSRGFTWVNGDEIKNKLAPDCKPTNIPGLKNACEITICPMSPEVPLGKMGLIWIGKKFYSISEWLNEAHKKNPKSGELVGISRRIKSLPRDFKVGETRVFMAHIEAIETPCPDCILDGVYYVNKKCEKCKGEAVIYSPGIFQVFKPTAIEYVCRGDESEKEIEDMRKRGITPVIVKKIEEKNGELFECEGKE